jgi:sialate O-acetylesterase
MNVLVKYSALLFILWFPLNKTFAEITLPPIISDHMVLQQGTRIRIWGDASVGEQVTVSVLNQIKNTTANQTGKWEVWLNPTKSNTPVDMVISGKNSITIKDVLFGDVWFGAGQSNMEWKVKQSNNAEFEIANSANPQIRIFKVNKKNSNMPLEEVSGRWALCGPDIVGEVSGCLYFFGRDLFKERNGPLGLIEAGWGATPGQSWLSKEAIEEVPELAYILSDWNKILSDYPTAFEKYKQELKAWESDTISGKTSNIKTPKAPQGPGDKNEPASIFNGIVAPLSKYKIKGVLWYQGEANAYEKTAYPYRLLLKALIRDWRNKWGQGDLPFLIAQLSTLYKHPYWPILRESQAEVAAQLLNTALIVTIDVGDSTDAHFRNKQEVGRRFALAARHMVYGENIEYSGPVFKNATRKGDFIKIRFNHAKGLQTKGGNNIEGFKISGANGVVKPADARFDGSNVLIPCQGLTAPITIYYAFTDAPVCNLFNEAGLPAVPFRITIR